MKFSSESLERMERRDGKRLSKIEQKGGLRLKIKISEFFQWQDSVPEQVSIGQNRAWCQVSEGQEQRSGDLVPDIVENGSRIQYFAFPFQGKTYLI